MGQSVNEKDVEELAKEIVNQTELTEEEAKVVIGERMGLDPEDTNQFLDRSSKSIEHMRADLREKARKIPTRIERLERTLKELEEL